MKIITLLRKTMDGQPIEYNDSECDPRDWWCKIETEEETLVYDKAIDEGGDYLRLWNEMLNHAGQGMDVCWGEDDIYGYIGVDTFEPEVGDEYKDPDGDIWVRVE